jgi:hypothetical protein
VKQVRAGGPRQFRVAPIPAGDAVARRAPTALSYIAACAGIIYAVSGIDLIPNSTPWFGHLDEFGFCVGGLALAFVLARPPAIAAKPHRLPAWLLFRVRVLRADLGNFFFVQHRYVDGFLVTGKNSGSHWLKFMLSAGIAFQHGLPLPGHSTGQDAEDIVGHPARPRRYAGIPRIGTTHTIPSALLRYIPRALVRRPPIVLMVRAIDSAMLSNYTKWHADYQAPLAEFVRGDPFGRRFVADIWWYIHFFNRWGDWAKADPERILVVRYEDLAADPGTWLGRIANHLRLGFDEAALQAALRFRSKDAIRALQDPNAGEIIVPDAAVTPRAVYSAADRRFINETLARYLRHDFGYVKGVPVGKPHAEVS